MLALLEYNYNIVLVSAMQQSESAKHVYTRIPLSWTSLPTLPILSIEGVEKGKPCCTVGGSVNWYSHYGEQYGGL